MLCERKSEHFPGKEKCVSDTLNKRLNKKTEKKHEIMSSLTFETLVMIKLHTSVMITIATATLQLSFFILNIEHDTDNHQSFCFSSFYLSKH